MITEELTGDAFVDLGRQAILRLAGKTVVDDEELRRMVASQAQLYVHDWAAKLNAFYLNSSITQTQGVYATSEGKLAKRVEYSMQLLRRRRTAIARSAVGMRISSVVTARIFHLPAVHGGQFSSVTCAWY